MRKTFTEQMEFSGFAIGANDASYKALLPEGVPQIERVFNGIRENITGFCGTPFASIDCAILWAENDQEMELTPNSRYTPLSERTPVNQ